MMKRMLVMLLAGAMLLACVPTPEEDVVVGKADGRLEQKIDEAASVPAYAVESDLISVDAPQDAAGTAAENTLKSALGAPEHLNDSCSGIVYGGTMDVTIDADVDVPNVSKVPVCRVALGGFSAEERERIAKAVLGDGPYVKIPHDEPTQKMNELRYRQAWLNALESKPYGPNANDAEVREWLTGSIDVYQEAYRQAEAPGAVQPWSGSFADADGAVNNEAGYGFHWMETQAKFCQIGYQKLFDVWYTGDAYHLAPRTDAERTADAAARAFLKQMHTTDMQLKGVAAHDEGWRDYFGTEAGYDNGVTLLWYLPSYAGIPVYPWVTYHGTDNGKQDAGVHYDYDAEQESIKVVTENGTVTRADWYCPLHVLGVENENVALLPFEKILEIFKQQVFMNIYIGKDYLGNDSHTIMHISEIHFSYMRVRKPDETDYWLLPVWDFRGYEEYAWKEMNGIDGWWDDFSILTVNAIDGSIIDRNLGY